nr:putative capsid [Marmot picobirnavirus]
MSKQRDNNNGKTNTTQNKKTYSNNGKSSRSKRSSYGNKSHEAIREASENGTGTKFGGVNDVSWYAANPQLLSDAASLPFSHAIGTRIEPTFTNVKNSGIPSIPGVCSIYLTPCPGKSGSNYSTINIAARNLYSFVRHANSGHANYDSPDLMLYVLAMDSIYYMLSHAIRVYGIARTYSQVNRYYPEALLEAMLMDPKDVITNLAELRYNINTLIVKVGSLCVPASFKYLTRHFWLFSSVYADTNDPKCQSYVFVPHGYYQFDPVAYTTGGALHYQQFDEKLHTVSDLIKIINNMVSAVITDEDMNIMSGDILKAFGSDGVFKISGIPEEYSVVPEYNPEVLMQINNTVCVGRSIATTFASGITPEEGYHAPDIWQNTDGAIMYKPEIMVQAPAGHQEHLLNMPMLNPTPADVMVATRLTAIATGYDGHAYDESDGEGLDVRFYHVFEAIGSEFAQYMKIFYFGWTWDKNSETNVWSLKTLTVHNGHTDFQTDRLETYMSCDADARGFENLKEWCVAASAISKFHNHPQIHMCVKKGTDPDDLVDYEDMGFIGDVNTYTQLDYNTLYKMHQTALLSMFEVPQMGTVSRR